MKCTVLILTVWTCVQINAAQAQNPGLQSELQEVLEVFLAENSIAPGVIAYAKCPELLLEWSGASGQVAHDDSRPLSPRHTFRIASNTKTYVAAATLRLVEMRRLDLDGCLDRYLTPDQTDLLESDGYDTEAITVSQVLSHTAGLADHTTDQRFVETILKDHQHKWTSREQIQRLVEWCDPLGPPGEQYVYSDSGYVILGTIIESRTGKKLGPAVRELLGYDRLGLKVTYWEYLEDPPADTRPRAHQYYGSEDVTGWNASFDLYGGGGLITDVRELALFTRQLIQGEVFKQPPTLMAMIGRGTTSYRLGLMVMECEGHLIYGHQGFWNTFAFHVPSLNLTVSGTVLNHDATNGKELACRLVTVVAEAARELRP